VPLGDGITYELDDGVHLCPVHLPGLRVHARLEPRLAQPPQSACLVLQRLNALLHDGLPHSAGLAQTPQSACLVLQRLNALLHDGLPHSAVPQPLHVHTYMRNPPGVSSTSPPPPPLPRVEITPHAIKALLLSRGHNTLVLGPPGLLHCKTSKPGCGKGQLRGGYLLQDEQHILLPTHNKGVAPGAAVVLSCTARTILSNIHDLPGQSTMFMRCPQQVQYFCPIQSVA